MFSAVILFIYLVDFQVMAGPTEINMARNTFQNDVNYPSINMLLLAIENKLRNIENTISSQCDSAINQKIEYYGRKLDNIEKELSRFQLVMRIEVDKISENITHRNFKDDLMKDLVLRKVDGIYEKIHHKFTSLESQIGISNVKLQHAEEKILAKMDKMEERQTIRDADMEAELADSVSAIDDIKTSCVTIEENVFNLTRETTKAFFKTNEKLLKKQHGQTLNFLDNINRTVANKILNMQHNVDLLLNETTSISNAVHEAQDEANENLNEFASKITNIHIDLSEKSNRLSNTLYNLGKITNQTRNELQNRLRALTVEVGRMSGKPALQTSTDNKKLTELSQKIDSNFENIMLAQNLFLDSCHRVQMDESQLESQISMVLDKLIDIFENKTSVGPKDIEKLGNLIRTHDTNIRRSLYQIMNNLLNLMQKTTSGSDEIINYINNQTLQLETILVFLEDILIFNGDFDKTAQNVLETVQNIRHQLINKTYVGLNNSSTNLILKMFNTSNDTMKLQQMLDFIKNIYQILTSIEVKMNKSYVDYMFNIAKLAQHFDKKLNDHIQSNKSFNHKLAPDFAEKTEEKPVTFDAPIGEAENSTTNEGNQDLIDKIILLYNNDTVLHYDDKTDNTKYSLMNTSSNNEENNTQNITELRNSKHLPTVLEENINEPVNNQKNSSYTSTNKTFLESITNSTPEYLDLTINATLDTTSGSTIINQETTEESIHLLDEDITTNKNAELEQEEYLELNESAYDENSVEDTTTDKGSGDFTKI